MKRVFNIFAFAMIAATFSCRKIGDSIEFYTITLVQNGGEDGGMTATAYVPSDSPQTITIFEPKKKGTHATFVVSAENAKSGVTVSESAAGIRSYDDGSISGAIVRTLTIPAGFKGNISLEAQWEEVNPSYAQIEGVYFQSSDYYIEKDGNMQLFPSTQPNNAEYPDFFFVSSNPSLASVDASGVVTACADSGDVSVFAVMLHGQYQAECKIHLVGKKCEGTVGDAIAALSQEKSKAAYLSINEGSSLAGLGQAVRYHSGRVYLDLSKMTDLQKIDEGEFGTCTSLAKVVFPETLKSIGAKAFLTCNSLSDVDFGEMPQLETVGGSAFMWAALKNIRLPKHLKRIGEWAFRDCPNLKSVILPDELEFIDGRAFQDCDVLESICIPASTKQIGDSAFSSCQALKTLTIENGVSSLKIGNAAFDGCGSLGGELKIPDGVVSIGGRAFYNCTRISSVSIADSVADIGEYAFFGCERLVSANIPRALKVIRAGMFSITRLSEIIIPDGVQEIGDNAFRGASIAKIEIPASLESIGGTAFLDCKSLSTVIFNGTKEQWNAIRKAGDWKMRCGIKTVTCTDGNVSV